MILVSESLFDPFQGEDRAMWEIQFPLFEVQNVDFPEIVSTQAVSCHFAIDCLFHVGLEHELTLAVALLAQRVDQGRVCSDVVYAVGEDQLELKTREDLNQVQPFGPVSLQ